MTPTQATQLPEVLRFFDPRRRLTDELLTHWFIERDESPRQSLRVVLEYTPERQKVLFVGHRGSGKTTELTKLASELRNQYESIGFDILDITGRTTINYQDLLLALSTQVTLHAIGIAATNQPLLLAAEDRWREIREWWANLVAGGVSLSAVDEANVALSLKTMLAEIQLGVKQSSGARNQIGREVDLRVSELIGHLDWVCQQIEISTTRRVLIIVEGLDKLDDGAARDVFLEHAATLTAPQMATIIYSFPISLRYTDAYRTICLSFNDQVFYFPNIAQRHHDRSENLKNMASLRELVLRRMRSELIAPEALDYLIASNGGVPSWLVRLVQKAATYALTRSAQATRIEIADAQRAVRDIRREIQAPLTREELGVLRQRHRDRQLINDPAESSLLRKGALIDYANGEVWADAHPALWALLETAEDDQQP